MKKETIAKIEDSKCNAQLALEMIRQVEGIVRNLDCPTDGELCRSFMASEGLKYTIEVLDNNCVKTLDSVVDAIGEGAE